MAVAVKGTELWHSRHAAATPTPVAQNFGPLRLRDLAALHVEESGFQVSPL